MGAGLRFTSRSARQPHALLAGERVSHRLPRCYNFAVMPTTRPRHQVTESDAVRRALQLAAERWPQDAARPSRLLRLLIERGEQAINGEHERAQRRRREAIRRHAGSGTGEYPPGYLEEVRRGWPD
jgi:hypothetical protein